MNNFQDNAYFQNRPIHFMFSPYTCSSWSKARKTKNAKNLLEALIGKVTELQFEMVTTTWSPHFIPNWMLIIGINIAFEWPVQEEHNPQRSFTFRKIQQVSPTFGNIKIRLNLVSSTSSSTSWELHAFEGFFLFISLRRFGRKFSR